MFPPSSRAADLYRSLSRPSIRTFEDRLRRGSSVSRITTLILGLSLLAHLHRAAARSGDFGDERVARRLAPEKIAHHLRPPSAAASREYGLAEAVPDRRIHQVVSIHRKHVEREDFRPHIAVITRRVASDNMLEGARKLRSRDMSKRRVALHPVPQRERVADLRAAGHHIVRRVQVLARIAYPCAIEARR